MTHQEFLNCTKEELHYGARESFAQARAQLHVAEQAAKLDNYGIGTSLLILSVEESVKAMILIAGYLDTPSGSDFSEGCKTFLWCP